MNLLRKLQSEIPSITRRKMRRKKKVPDARYTMAVVKLMETLLRSDMAVASRIQDTSIFLEFS